MKIEKIQMKNFTAFSSEALLAEKINELIDAINEMSEGCEFEYRKGWYEGYADGYRQCKADMRPEDCEHKWESHQYDKKCIYCGIVREVKHGDILHRDLEDKQEDEGYSKEESKCGECGTPFEDSSICLKCCPSGNIKDVEKKDVTENIDGDQYWFTKAWEASKKEERKQAALNFLDAIIEADKAREKAKNIRRVVERF